MSKLNIKYIAALGVFILLVYIGYLNQPLLMHTLTKLQTLPEPQLVICFSLLYIIANLFLLPIGLPLNLFAGLVWGTFFGGLVVNLLATFVAAISFYLARIFGDHFLKNILYKNSMFRSLKNTINQYDWQFISMARINPVVPFSLSNYLFGLIPELSFRHYLTATVLANLLPCFVFAAVGSMIKSFSVVDSQIHYFVLNAGIVLLLISVLVTIKMLLSNHQKKFSIKKEAA